MNENLNQPLSAEVPLTSAETTTARKRIRKTAETSSRKTRSRKVKEKATDLDIGASEEEDDAVAQTQSAEQVEPDTAVIPAQNISESTTGHLSSDPSAAQTAGAQPASAKQTAEPVREETKGGTTPPPPAPQHTASVMAPAIAISPPAAEVGKTSEPTAKPAVTMPPPRVIKVPTLTTPPKPIFPKKEVPEIYSTEKDLMDSPHFPKEAAYTGPSETMRRETFERYRPTSHVPEKTESIAPAVGPAGGYKDSGYYKSAPWKSGTSGFRQDYKKDFKKPFRKPERTPVARPVPPKPETGAPGKPSTKTSGAVRHKSGKRRGDYYEYDVGSLPEYEVLENYEEMLRLAESCSGQGEEVRLNMYLQMDLTALEAETTRLHLTVEDPSLRQQHIEALLVHAFQQKRTITVEGFLDLSENGLGFLVYPEDHYKISCLSTYVPHHLIRRFSLRQGQAMVAQIAPPRLGETTPFILRLESVQEMPVESVRSILPFEELHPCYPTERFSLGWGAENGSMELSLRFLDVFVPMGKGQRVLFMVPQQFPKASFLQQITARLAQQHPELHIQILVLDERPEEIARLRQILTAGELIASAFDCTPQSHVQCAELILEKAKRLVELDQHVCLIVDSLSLLTKAYQAVANQVGKQPQSIWDLATIHKTKRYFAAARCLEEGGSLTMIGILPAETGSKWDEAILEELRGKENCLLWGRKTTPESGSLPPFHFESCQTIGMENLVSPQEMEAVAIWRQQLQGQNYTLAWKNLLNKLQQSISREDFLQQT